MSGYLDRLSRDLANVAKGYKVGELTGRNETAVLDSRAGSRAKRHIPMTMEDWAKRIDAYLSSDERPLLSNRKKITWDDFRGRLRLKITRKVVRKV